MIPNGQVVAELVRVVGDVAHDNVVGHRVVERYGEIEKRFQRREAERTLREVDAVLAVLKGDDNRPTDEWTRASSNVLVLGVALGNSSLFAAKVASMSLSSFATSLMPSKIDQKEADRASRVLGQLAKALADFLAGA